MTAELQPSRLADCFEESPGFLQLPVELSSPFRTLHHRGFGAVEQSNCLRHLRGAFFQVGCEAFLDVQSPFGFADVFFVEIVYGPRGAVLEFVVRTQQLVSVGNGFVKPCSDLSEFVFKKMDVCLAFAQEIGGFGNVQESGELRKRATGTDTDEKVCRLGIARLPRDGSLGSQVPAVKREGLDAVLEKDSHVGKAFTEGSGKFGEFEFVFVKGIRPGLGSRFGVVEFVGSGDEKKAIWPEDSLCFG